ncbi:hypothetical protein BJF78_02400 [Pseudonocardia sp. CNS-139]|nr:hypothetical protein BJF78_02400 [Pseudonocardia sp. CNS-139]
MTPGPGTPGLRVAHVTDTHLAADAADGRSAAGRAGWEAVAAALALDPPDLVVHTGDLVLGDPDTAADHTHARRLLAGLPCPVLVVPGNHDVGDHADRPDLPAAWLGKPVTEARCRRFREVWGGDRWAVRRAGWLLVGLNSLVLGSGLPSEAAQRDWLAAVLGAWPGPAAVFLHEPLVLDPDAGCAARETWAMPPVDARLRLLDALGAGPAAVVLVASGHLHRFRDVAAAGRRHVTAPSTAYPIVPQPGMPQPAGDPRPGYVRYDLRPDGTVAVTPLVLAAEPAAR